MDILSPVSPEDLFIDPLQNQAKLNEMANQALQSGIDYYTRGDYESAAHEFHRSVNLSPQSDYVKDATKYLCQSYIQLEQPGKAVKVYEDAVARDRSDEDYRKELGNLYYQMGRYEEAVTEYRAAVNINPSAENHYTLGQAYLDVENYSGAESEFNEVIHLEPQETAGYFGRGQTFAKQGDYADAINSFEDAVRIDGTFYDAYAEMGYAYADAGDFEEAEELAEFLEDRDACLSETLYGYINAEKPPEMMFAWGSGTFGYSMSKGTPLSLLDSYFENAGAEKSMTMKIQFTKDMDRSSIENPYNWSISRQQGSGPAQTYNFGDQIPATDATIPTYPDYVLYDEDSMSATIGFTLRQNENADATIDPSHIVFSFDGEDMYGKKMADDADEYSGYSKVF